MDKQEEIFFLKNKIILLISPQPWGNLYISKHHYAIELAKDNTVYFLSPIIEAERYVNLVTIDALDGIKNLFIVKHSLFFPFQIKFHSRILFEILMKIQTKRILKAINKKIDIVWSFDLGNYFPFDFFSKTTLKIFHPVDEPLNNDAISSAKNADVIFSVTQEIINKYEGFHIPKFFVNHGLSQEFLKNSHRNWKKPSQQIHIGISGNLRRKDIDREILLEVVRDNHNVYFECWGEFQLKGQANSEEKKETDRFIATLQSYPNVNMHGLLEPDKLAEAYSNVDAFLICYDVKKDQSRGTNYHKIMEFLSTGKVVISNNVSTYKDAPELICMVSSREDNRELPILFQQVITNISLYNSEELQKFRIDFAQKNTYQNQLAIINNILLPIIANQQYEPCAELQES